MSDPVVEAIWREVDRLGSPRAVARRYAVSYSHLIRVAGGRSKAGARLARIFGCRPRGRKRRLASEGEIRLMLLDVVRDMATYPIAAREIGVSERYLRDVINGHDFPGPKIQRYLGYRRVWMYERIEG